MKKINKFWKWIYLGIAATTLTTLIVGTQVVSEYDEIIAGFINSQASTSTVTGGTTNEGVTSLGSSLCSELLEEGAVLLKNQQLESGINSLPIQARQRKVNIFGYGATDNGWLQYGIGSGSTRPQEAKSVNLLKAFDNSIYSYNKEIIESYKQFNWPKRANGVSGDTYKPAAYYQYEASRNWYESQPDLLDNAKRFSDTAIFVISRISGENTKTDLQSGRESVPAEQYLCTDGATTREIIKDRTYLQTTYVEEGVIDMLSENFKNVIVILNTSNAMFIDTIGEDDDRVDSLLFVGITGECGAAAIPEILWGKVNPSGHLSDTFPVNPKADPAFANRNDYSTPVFQESIYFGYKWYETADKEGFWTSQFAKDNFGIESYEDAVYRPFGYGQSYTTFDWRLVNVKSNETSINDGHVISDNTEISVEVEVTNTGSVAGKDVVQLYYSAPYKAGEIEKPAVGLLDFEKTPTLEPGQNVVLTLKFNPYDMASFDTYDANSNLFSGYELDAGAHILSLRSDAHTVKTVKTNTQENPLNFTINVQNEGIRFTNDPVTGTKVEPLLSGPTAYKGVSIDGKGFIGTSGAGVNYLTRSNFAGTFALVKTKGTITANKSVATAAADGDAFDLYSYTEFPKTDVDSGLRLVTKEDGSNASLSDLKGNTSAKLKLNEELILELNDYDHAKWETLLDQMDFDEYITLITLAGFKTSAVESIGKPQTRDIDGPAGFNGAYSTIPGIDPKWTSYPCETIIGCTFSKRLAYNLGCCLGAEAQSTITPVNGIYGPGVNLHRTPFGSRNYEYFSEDRVLTGVMAAEEIRGAKTNGLYMYCKHFVGDEMGSNPRNTTTWMTEQSLREEYCRPFEIAVKEGGANAVMTSFNKIGNVFAGYLYPLCTTMLRNEWGFEGMVLTDYYTGGDTSMDADRCIAAGNDAILNPKATYPETRTPLKTNVVHMNVARTSCKNIIYTYVSTYAYSLTHEVDDDQYNVEVGVSASQSPKSGVVEFLNGTTITLAIVFAAFTLLYFLRPVVKLEDGSITYSETETKIRKQVSRYLPFALLFASILLAFIARAILPNSFFYNFFSGLMFDISVAFSQFGFGVASNVVIYVGLLAIVGVIALFVLALTKNRKLDTILSHVGLLLSIVMTMIFAGVLLFALSTGVIIKNLVDVLLLLAVGVTSILALVLTTIKVIKTQIAIFKEKKETK